MKTQNTSIQKKPHLRSSVKQDESKRLKNWFLKIENIFIVFWVLIALPIAIFSAPDTGADEEAHIARAEQVAEGYFLPQKINIYEADMRIVGVQEKNYDLEFYGGKTDTALYELLTRRYAPIYNQGIDELDIAFPYWTDERYQVDMRLGEANTVWAFSASTIYSPICYLPHALGFIVAFALKSPPVIAVILMRLFGTLAFGFLIRFAIKITPICKHCVFLIAILPNSIAVNTMVSADTMTTACTILFISYCLKFIISFSNVTKLDWLGLGLSICCVSLLKMPYIVFGLLIVYIFLHHKLWKDKQSTLRILVIGFSSLLLFIIWMTIINNVDIQAISAQQNVDSKSQINFILSHPINSLKSVCNLLTETDLGITQMIAYTVTGVPIWIVAFGLMLSSMLDVQYCPLIKNRSIFSAILLGLSILTAILIVLALYISFTPVGASKVEGVQSRYFIPLLLPIFASIVMLAKDRPKATPVTSHKEAFEALQIRHVNKEIVIYIFVYYILVLHAYAAWLPF